MSQITPLTIANGEVPAVDTTFSVHSGQQGNLSPAVWYFQDGNFANWKEITLSTIRKSSTNRVVSKVRVPDQTATGVQYQSLCNLSVIVSAEASEAHRLNLVAYLRGLVNSNEFAAAVVTGSPQF